MQEEQKKLQKLLSYCFYSLLRSFKYYQAILLELRSHPIDKLNALPGYVEHLTHHLQKCNHPIPPLLLLNIACCIPGQHRGIRPTLLCLEKGRGGFSTRRLIEATYFLDKFYEDYTLFLELPDEIKNILFPTHFTLEGDILKQIEIWRILQEGDTHFGAWSERHCSRTRHERLKMCSQADVAKTSDFTLFECIDKFLSLLATLEIPECPDKKTIKNIYEQLDEETCFHLTLLSKKLKKIKSHRDEGKEIANTIDYFKNISQFETLDNEMNFYYELEYYSGDAINKPTQPLQTILPCEEICGCCGHELIILFRLNLQDPKLNFLQIPQAESLDIAFCLLCTDCDTTYTSIDSNGKITWRNHHKNHEEHMKKCFSEDDKDSLESICDKLILGSKHIPKQKFSCIAKEYGASHLGGQPIWIQGPEYPKCLECKQKMKFVGQIDGNHFPHFPKENNYYAFFCSSCLITAVNSQYT